MQTGWGSVRSFYRIREKIWSQLFIIKIMLKENIFSYPAQLTPASSTELEFYHMEKDFMVGYNWRTTWNEMINDFFPRKFKTSNYRHVRISINATIATKCSWIVDVILALIHVWAGFRYLVDTYYLLNSVSTIPSHRTNYELKKYLFYFLYSCLLCC